MRTKWRQIQREESTQRKGENSRWEEGNMEKGERAQREHNKKKNYKRCGKERRGREGKQFNMEKKDEWRVQNLKQKWYDSTEGE